MCVFFFFFFFFFYVCVCVFVLKKTRENILCLLCCVLGEANQMLVLL